MQVPQLPIAVVTDFINEWAHIPQEISPRPWTGYPGKDSVSRQILLSRWPQELPVLGDTAIA